MIPSLSDLLTHGWQSVRAPREELRWVLAHAVPRQSRWEILILLTLGTVIVTVLHHMALFGEALFLVVVDEMGAPIVQVTPYLAAITAVSGSVLTAFLVFWCGRAFGGDGSLPDTVLTLGWMQFILLVVGAAQAVLALILPGAADLVGLLAMVLTMWLFCQFVAELHGFSSALKVFFATLGIAFGLGLLVTLLAGSLAAAGAAL